MVNNSGITPLDTRVLVLPDLVEKKSPGGIILTETLKEKQQWAQVKGTFVAAGSNAFLEWGVAAARPEPGSRVVITQYGGVTHDGADGQKYVVMDDKDILALVEG